MRVGNSRGALRRFGEALAANPENADALAGLAQSHLNLGERAEAAEPIAALLRVAPNGATGHRLQAEALRRQRRFAEAVNSARQALTLDPRNPFGHHILALCLRGQTGPKAALAACDQGLAITPGSAILHAQRGDLLLELRGPKAAGPSCDQALKLDPDSPYVLRACARVALADGHLQRARDLLSVVLRRNANDREALGLYLLTEPGRHGVLRGFYIFRYWRRGRPILGAVVWFGAWTAFIGLTLLLAAATAGAPLFLGFAMRWFMQSQYDAHRNEVQAHFTRLSLSETF